MRPKIKERVVMEESNFYHMYFEMQNLKKEKEMKITERENQLASLICSKPEGFFISTGKALDGKSKKYQMAKEIGVSNHQIYGLLKNLRRKGILQEDEDKLWELTPGIKSLRKTVKEMSGKQDFLFDYVFEFTIRKNGNNDNGHSRKESKALERAGTGE